MKKIIDWVIAKKIMFFGIGATIIVLVIGVLLFDIIIMPIYTHHWAERELPDVTELSFDEAKILLKKNGLKIVEDRKIFQSTYPESTIIQQHPLPYSLVKKGRRIFVTISAGEKQVDVPDVLGKSERDAIYTLQKSRLEPVLPPYYEYDDFRPEGAVCKQSIPAGSRVYEHTSINITISNGPEPKEFFVPNLVGKSLETCQKMLRKSGLIMGIIDYRVEADILPNTVIAQTIEAGIQVEKNQPVSIVLSRLKEDQEE